MCCPNNPQEYLFTGFSLLDSATGVDSAAQDIQAVKSDVHLSSADAAAESHWTHLMGRLTTLHWRHIQAVKSDVHLSSADAAAESHWTLLMGRLTTLHWQHIQAVKSDVHLSSADAFLPRFSGSVFHTRGLPKNSILSIQDIMAFRSPSPRLTVGKFIGSPDTNIGSINLFSSTVDNAAKISYRSLYRASPAIQDDWDRPVDRCLPGSTSAGHSPALRSHVPGIIHWQRWCMGAVRGLRGFPECSTTGPTS